MTFNTENGEKWASQLWQGSILLCELQDLLNNLARHSSPAIIEEKEVNFRFTMGGGKGIILL